MTAVEWLVQELEGKGDALASLSTRRLQISIDVSDYLELKNKAKEMEKEQIVQAAARGYLVGEDEISLEDAKLYGEEYYEMTFNTKEK